MQDGDSFYNIGPCEQVDKILGGFPLNSYETPYFWEARAHAVSCVSCQQRHPNATRVLSDQIRQLESVLALELETVQCDHIKEAGAIGREATSRAQATRYFH